MSTDLLGGRGARRARPPPPEEEYDEEAAAPRSRASARAGTRPSTTSSTRPSGRARQYAAPEEEEEAAEYKPRSRARAGASGAAGGGAAAAAGGGGGRSATAAGGGRTTSSSRARRGEEAQEEPDEEKGMASKIGSKGGGAGAGSAAGGGGGRARKGGGGGDDDDLGQGNAPKDAFMEAFFNEVNQVKATLDNMNECINQLLAIHEKTKTTTRPAQMKRLKDSMGDKVEEIARGAQVVTKKLQIIEKDNEKSRKRPNCGPNSATDRTRSSATNVLKKKLQEIMGHFNELKNTVHGDYKETVERRFYTVTGKKASDDQVEEMIESGESEQLFQKAILNQGRGALLDTLSEITERHEAIKSLEKSLLELHQIFMDMAVLVEAQGEVLNNIETHVSKSVDFVQQGAQYLQQTKEYQKSSRKWMCCGFFIAILIGLILFVGIGRPWRKKKN